MKVVFISHDASRTGAPILLFNLVQAIKQVSKNYEFRFLIKRAPYDLLSDFEKLGDTFVDKRNFSDRIISKVTKEVFSIDSFSFSSKVLKAALKDVDVVISNTITNGDILPLVRKRHSGTIMSYIHELEMATSFFTTPNKVKQLISISNHFLVPSFAVKRFLIDVYKVEDTKISELSYYIPTLNNTSLEVKNSQNNVLVIGGAGTTDWRKGTDLFVQTAKLFKTRYPQVQIKFVWKGANMNSLDLKRLLYDVKSAGLADLITFEPASSKMFDFYQSIDVFLLTSREDPYPLVVLEAARAGVPTICFSNTGGAIEFIEKSHGFKPVSYLDLSGLVEKINQLVENRSMAIDKGVIAKQLMERTHLNASYVADQFDSVIQKVNNG